MDKRIPPSARLEQAIADLVEDAQWDPARLGVDEDKALAWVEKRYGQPLDALSAEQVADAVRSLANELNRRNGLSAERRGNRRRAA